MKGMVDYRYITHWDCIMKRHTCVSFRELKIPMSMNPIQAHTSVLANSCKVFTLYSPH